MPAYYRKDDMGIIEFNDPGSKVNLLSNKTLDMLEEFMGCIETDPALKTLFFISTKKDIFIAGADIKELAEITTKEEALRLCKKGQDLFDRIERLKIPTISIVDGACIGGGLELALSCKHIFATHNKKVRLGLPEVKLGISPGFGGTHRLPRKVGDKYAGELMHTGRLIDANIARRIKLIDRIISEKERFDYKALLRKCKKTRVSLVQDRLSKLNDSERDAVADKILKEPAKNALNMFLLMHKYRDCPWIKEGRKIKEIRRCSVIGAGIMGKGIAYLASLKGMPVGLIEKDKNILKNARCEIKGVYNEAIKKAVLYPCEARLRFKNISFKRAPLKESDMIIETITEDMFKKKTFFSDIEHALKKDCIVATNTSCISIQELSKSLKNAELFLGVHFFNPAYKMKLVEVIPTIFTNPSAVGSVINFLHRLDRIPIIVKDSPGFLVNRILLPYLNEAVAMIEEGFSVHDIEKAMLEFGMPMGPLELLNHIGTATAYRASRLLKESFGSRMKVPNMLREYGEKNLKIDIQKTARDSAAERADIHTLERLLGPMRREAELCLHEGIVEHKEIIDAALSLGIGFPNTKRIWKHTPR